MFWLSICLGLLFPLLAGAAADESPGGWVMAAELAAPEAHQAAAADQRFFYAINNTTVAKYDRQTGRRVSVSEGEARHLNSGWIRDGQLYCAHSNYPQTPERSELRVVDLKTMRLSVFKDFGESAHGSLTWAVHHDGFWWCNFARYGDQNHRTVLVQYDDDWRQLAVWRYPPEVLAELGSYSVSGGIWRSGQLLTTGHDDRVLYRLRLPDQSATPDGQGDQQPQALEYIDTVPAPFTGQGIAEDPATGGLVGIDRARRRIVVAAPAAD